MRRNLILLKVNLAKTVSCVQDLESKIELSTEELGIDRLQTTFENLFRSYSKILSDVNPENQQNINHINVTDCSKCETYLESFINEVGRRDFEKMLSGTYEMDDALSMEKMKYFKIFKEVN